MRIIAKYLDKSGDTMIIYDQLDYYDWIFKTNPYEKPTECYSPGSHDEVKNYKKIWPIFSEYVKKVK